MEIFEERGPKIYQENAWERNKEQYSRNWTCRLISIINEVGNLFACDQTLGHPREGALTKLTATTSRWGAMSKAILFDLSESHSKQHPVHRTIYTKLP